MINIRAVFGNQGSETAYCILTKCREFRKFPFRFVSSPLQEFSFNIARNQAFNSLSCALPYVFMLPVRCQFSLGCCLPDEWQVGFPVGRSLCLLWTSHPPLSEQAGGLPLHTSALALHALLMSCRNIVNPKLMAITVSQQAIESFALTVKEIAQMLQCFGTELAETELPEDMYSIERILALRTERYCQLKVWLSRAPPCARPGGVSGGSLFVWCPLLLPCRACVRVVRQSRAQRDCFCAFPVHSPCIEQLALPAASRLPELPAPSCLQQSLSVACSSRGLCTSGCQEGRGRLCHLRVPDPLCLTPLSAESCMQSSSARLEGWFVPWSLCLVDLPRET